MLPPDAVAARLGHVASRLQTAVRRTLVREGVSVAAARTLATLEREGPLRLTELAAREQVTQPSMSALIARLEAQELVRRSIGGSDRRLVIVSVTDTGRRLLASILERRASLLSARLAVLPEAERAAIERALPALDHLIELMEERTPVAREA